MMMMIVQIEREREEHLLPRLASSPQSDVPEASVIHIRSDTPDSQSSDHDLVIDQKPAATAAVVPSHVSKVIAMPTVQPAPEPVSPEPIATRSLPRRSPEPPPTFVSIPAVSALPVFAPAVAPPAMVAMPTMVPAPVAMPSNNISGPMLPTPEPAPTVPEKPKTSLSGVAKPG